MIRERKIEKDRKTGIGRKMGSTSFLLDTIVTWGYNLPNVV